MESSSWVSDPNYRGIRHLKFDPTVPSELPPRPPRAFFGRNELVDWIINLVGNFAPLALIGPGGIGKTSIALTILHNDRIKQRFGDDRRFIRCDQFPASLSNFLRRLSAVTGAGVENPDDLTPLQPLLSSKEMLIVLDNAESILDPEGTDSREIYDVVEELSQFDNICLLITSRISTIPPSYEILNIPTLSMDAARDAFYGIYKKGKRSDMVDKILEQLDFHPLSVTLLATVGHQNKWDIGRLTKEWEKRRTSVLQTDHKKSLAATIELSLASPLFQELGPDTRALLEVVAFFPQGVDENNLDWLFPTVPNRENIFDKFCVLSLTYRNNSFVTMLAPLRDYLRPKDPKSSPLLCAAKGHYFRRLSVGPGPDEPDREETQWITSEDVNVEHILDVFSSIDTDSNNVWEACADFLQHLNWHKRRPIVLGSRIEGLPDDHPPKPRCLVQLAHIFWGLGNLLESKQLLVYALKLWRTRGDDHEVAITLELLATVNIGSGLYVEGISQVKKALEIYEKLDNAVDQVDCLHRLAFFSIENGQVDAAEEAASRAINLSSGGPSQAQLSDHHYALGHICQRRGKTEAAIDHYVKAIEMARPLNSKVKLRRVIPSLMELLIEEERFDDAQVYLEQLKPDLVGGPVHQGMAMLGQAQIWYHQGKLEEARSKLLRSIDLFEGFGTPPDHVGKIKEVLQEVEMEMKKRAAFD